jgi:hypothetical protein
MSKKPARKSPRKFKVIDYHAQIEAGAPLHLTDALDALRLDPALDALDDDLIYTSAHKIATKVYRLFEDVSHAYNVAMGEVQEQMGDDWFNRLEGAGAAAERRLVLAAYFLGVRCGRITQPVSGGAR